MVGEDVPDQPARVERARKAQVNRAHAAANQTGACADDHDAHRVIGEPQSQRARARVPPCIAPWRRPPGGGQVLEQQGAQPDKLGNVLATRQADTTYRAF